ncbi:hypothetical protein [Pseudomonas sp. 2FE]|uniref:hypothetical protein n=1 Tax=Pseudomonas sp. 2FE TaxID=2502190 RepID=UPI0010FA3C76|nr:hypothetical protein [Pseudomonas sp. 2FE]
MLYRYLLIALLGLTLSSGGTFARDNRYHGYPRYYGGWVYPEYRYRFDGYLYYNPYRYRAPDYHRDFRHDWHHGHRFDSRFDRRDDRHHDFRHDMRRGMDRQWRGDYRY